MVQLKSDIFDFKVVAIKLDGIPARIIYNLTGKYAFNIYFKSGTRISKMSHYDMLKLSLDEFKINEDADLGKIIIKIEADLEKNYPGLIEYMKNITQDPAVVIKMYTFLDSYLYTAKLASKDLSESTSPNVYLIPTLIVNNQAKKPLLENLKVTLKRRGWRITENGHEFVSGKKTNYLYIAITDPDSISRKNYNFTDETERGIALEYVNTDLVTPNERQRFIHLEHGRTVKRRAADKGALLALDGLTGNANTKIARHRSADRVAGHVQNIDDNLKQYLSIDNIGRIVEIKVVELYKSPNKTKLLKKLLELKIIAVEDITTFRSTTFRGMSLFEINQFFRKNVDEVTHIAKTKTFIETILNHVIIRHKQIDSLEVTNVLDYLKNPSTSTGGKNKTITPSYFTKYIVKFFKNVIKGKYSISRRIGFAEGLIIDILDKKILEKINDQILVNSLLTKTFIHEIGMDSTDAVNLASKILNESGFTNLTVGELYKKETCGRAVSPSTIKGTDIDSYEVITQRIANGYLSLVRKADTCGSKFACIDIDTKKISAKNKNQQKYLDILKAVEDRKGKTKEVYNNNHGADYVNDKEAFIFLSLIHTAINNPKGLEVSYQALHSAYNVGLSVILDGTITKANLKILEDSTNNPTLITHLKKTKDGRRLLEAGFLGIFSSNQFKFSEVTKKRLTGSDLISMKDFITLQYIGENIPRNKNDIFSNLDIKFAFIDSNGNAIPLTIDLEGKIESSQTLSPKQVNSAIKAAQFNEIYRPTLDIEIFSTTNVDKYVIEYNLKQLNELSSSEFRGRVIINEDSRILALSGGKDDNIKAIRNFLTILKEDGKYKSQVTGRVIVLNQTGTDKAVKAELSDLIKLNNRRHGLLNRLKDIMPDIP